MAKNNTDAVPRSTTRRRAAGAAAPPGAAADAAVHNPTHDEIAEAAYRRYLSRGGQHGGDFDDWVEAEQELRAPKS